MKIDKTIVKLLEEKLSVIQGAQVRPPSQRAFMLEIYCILLYVRNIKQ